MTEEKTCHNCGNKNCNVYYSIVKKDCKRHYETYEYRDFDCVNHDKWEELKVEEIRTDNTETLKNALERIKELEKKNAELKAEIEKMKVQHFTDIRLYTKVIGIAVEESVMKDKQNYKNYLFDKAKKILSMGVDK